MYVCCVCVFVCVSTTALSIELVVTMVVFA